MARLMAAIEDRALLVQKTNWAVGHPFILCCSCCGERGSGWDGRIRRVVTIIPISIGCWRRVKIPRRRNWWRLRSARISIALDMIHSHAWWWRLRTSVRLTHVHLQDLWWRRKRLDSRGPSSLSADDAKLHGRLVLERNLHESRQCKLRLLTLHRVAAPHDLGEVHELEIVEGARR
jgi:hypothetical protein